MKANTQLVMVLAKGGVLYTSGEALWYCIALITLKLQQILVHP
jgi:hypothetical protein